MKVALIADTFPPLKTSGAVQLRDLSRAFSRNGFSLTVFLPDSSLTVPWRTEQFDGVQLIRLRAPQTKDIGYVRRTLAEFFMPFFMRRNFLKSPLAGERWGGVVWYSPSIFHGPLVSWLRQRNGCKSYLIIRDIFPEWAVDMGLMGRGLPYRIFRLIARYQYSVADVIGVQTPGNLAYFNAWVSKPGRRLEVLQNWLDRPANKACRIRVADTALANRLVFVYAGNMGVAQGMDILLELAAEFLENIRLGFLFVGRGSEYKRLEESAESRGLSNTLFFDEIDPDEIPDLYAQCHVGMVALDPRHKSHNIPGKFLTYMQSGMPVLANINAGNDLADLIRSERVGVVCETNQVSELSALVNVLLDRFAQGDDFKSRCNDLFDRQFSVDHTVRQITHALSAPERSDA